MEPDASNRVIGRKRELEALRVAMDRAVSGQPNIALLAGASGIGKTSTALEISRQAGQCKVLALWGRCSEALGGSLPDENAQFVALSTDEASSELASMLHDQTEGHPLFLAELARDFQQAKSNDSTMAWSNMARRSKGMRGVIGARLKRLAPSSLRVLQSAAVFWREFRPDLLCLSLDAMSEGQSGR